jgi:cysteine desulfurase/selenocysteine lyase
MALPSDIYKDFPFFTQHGKQPIIYLDNAATTHKPQVVIDALVDFYTTSYGTVHRGVYTSGEHATTLYEDARATVAAFIGADTDEIIFTKNATEGINTVAYAWALHTLQPGDEILLSQYEHHANLLPWQRIAQARDAFIRFIPLNADGTLNLSTLDELVTPVTKLIAVSALSNVTGARTDLARIKQSADRVGAKMLVDAAQLIAHDTVNVHELAIDFLVFSGHKVYGPTGIGVLYCKRATMHEMQPFQVGGGTVFQATYTDATYLEGPHRFEAGTPAIAAAIGLAAALRYLQKFSMRDIKVHEARLTRTAIDALTQFPAITCIGPMDELKEQGHILTFVVRGFHPHDVAAFLSERGIAVRAGHHCAQPLAEMLGIGASVRISFAIYNKLEDVHALVSALKSLLKS